MGLNNIIKATDLLADYWHEQGITPGDDFDCKEFAGLVRELFLFEEFSYLYGKANGMLNKYPDDYDDKGFLFYPAGCIEPFKYDDRILLIGDYLNKCWWYGVRILSKESYEILIVEGKDKYTVASNSLSDFIFAYINNEKYIYPMYDV